MTNSRKKKPKHKKKVYEEPNQERYSNIKKNGKHRKLNAKRNMENKSV